jgi:hypothetical protein
MREGSRCLNKSSAFFIVALSTAGVVGYPSGCDKATALGEMIEERPCGHSTLLGAAFSPILIMAYTKFKYIIQAAEFVS